MVQVNRNFVKTAQLAKGAKAQEVMKEQPAKQNKEVVDKDTSGTNIGTPLPRILGGGGTRNNPYILDGKDLEEDMAYIRTLAAKRGDIYIQYSNGDSYLITPDGTGHEI